MWLPLASALPCGVGITIPYLLPCGRIMILATGFYKRWWELTISVLFPYPRCDLPLPCFQYFFKWPVIIEAKPRTLGYYSNVLPPFLPCDWFPSSLLCFLVLSLNSVKILLSFGLLSLLEVCRGGWNLLTASLLSLSEPNRVSMTSKVYGWIRTKFKSLLFCLLFQ